MSLALTTTTAAPIAAPLLTALTVPCGTIQPIEDVATYLAERTPVANYEDEQRLWVRLPGLIRIEVKALQSAVLLVQTFVKGRASVQTACRQALAVFRDQHWKLKTFRALYDRWMDKGDWTVLVNRSKAGIAWQERECGLSELFLQFVAVRFGTYKRKDAKPEAFRSIKRQWITGRDFSGNAAPIPGYGFAKDWWAKHNAPIGSFPPGWHYSNIMRQIKARNTLPKAAAMLLLQGTHAAKEFVPDVLGTRKGLRFLEQVQFDDLKTDWRIFDPATGEAMDLWLLIARDVATTMLLGFGMRPARAREDGTQEHLKLIDMEQLCGWVLERYGLPPYLMTWIIENGTATLSQGSAAALQEMLGRERIKLRYGSMIGGISPAGYFEKRLGNSKSKASLESHNRGIHLIGAALPGQTGPNYAARPADLAAREKECREIAQLSDFLPEHLRGQLGYSLLTLDQARTALFQIFAIQNRRDDHTLEDFETILEWYDDGRGLWLPQNSVPADGAHGVTRPTIRQRKEMPIERAARLVSGLEFTRISPDIITAFYEHTQRQVRVNDAGEIEFTHESRKLVFACPSANQNSQIKNQKLLAYYHPHDPLYLHLTDGAGAILGTWLQRGRVRDDDAVAQAIAYQAHALKQARELAHELSADQRAELDAMRTHNADLHAQHGFIEVAEAAPTSGKDLRSGVARGLAGIKAKKTRAEQAVRERDAADAELMRKHGTEGAEAILSSHPPRVVADEDDDFLKTISGRDKNEC